MVQALRQTYIKPVVRWALFVLLYLITFMFSLWLWRDNYDSFTSSLRRMGSVGEIDAFIASVISLIAIGELLGSGKSHNAVILSLGVIGSFILAGIVTMYTH